MLDFSITEIGTEPIETGRPVLDGCDACMHCRLVRAFRRKRSEGIAPARSGWRGTASEIPSTPSTCTSQSAE